MKYLFALTSILSVVIFFAYIVDSTREKTPPDIKPRESAVE